MRFIGKLLLRLVVLVGVLALVSFALPREANVSRSIVIDASPDAIFPHVNDLRKFTAWSPWAETDPNTKYDYTGPDQGVGQKVRWTSDHKNVGSGTQTITESILDQQVATALDFGDMGTATARFILSPQVSGTRVIWSFNTDLGSNPIMRWMGLMFDRWIGADYDKGLSNLKAAVEAQ